MTKKFFTLFFALVASVGTMFAWDYERVKIGDLYYNLDATNQTAEVTYKSYTNYEYNKGWGIKTANIPASVEYYGVGYSVTSIGEYAFDDCFGLKSVTIPNSVTSIGWSAFSHCTGLTSVTIPNSVTSIGDDAFSHCTGLTSVTIGNSVTSIGNGAFYYVPNIVYSGSATGLPWGARSINGYVDGYLVYSDEAKTNLLACSSAATGDITIPNSVTSIGDGAFDGCNMLTSVTIPNSVTSIGGFAFRDCTGLTSVTIPNIVTSIGDYAFEYCSGLTSVTIPNSVTSIGVQAFAGCSSLTSVTIPNSVTSIGGEAFDGCSGLTSVTIPNSVTSIGDQAFRDCSGLTSIEIPNSVTSIGWMAFYYCTGLTAPVYNAHVFAYLPTSYSGAYTIPDGIESIAGGAFLDCSGLTSVTIGNSVTSIGKGAFYYCKSLSSIYNYATSPQVIDSEVFGGEELVDGGIQYGPVDKSKCELYVPQESINLYRAAEGWKEFTNILPIGAQTVDVTTTTVTPSATTADIAWPQVSGAASSELVIKDKNGNVVCTLVFDAEGRLTSINFAAPGRDHNRQQTQTAGFAFSITGLESGTTYNYTLTAKDSNGKVLSTETGTFTTEGAPQGINQITNDKWEMTNKIIRDGNVLILRGEKTYTVTGQEVK